MCSFASRAITRSRGTPVLRRDRVGSDARCLTSPAVEEGEREVIPGFRWMLIPFVVLAVGATAGLYIGTTHTDDDFSWTISPALTAALLGAAYGGTLVFFGLALMERT